MCKLIQKTAGSRGVQEVWGKTAGKNQGEYRSMLTGIWVIAGSCFLAV
ncbi:MAG: hypothetical protein HFG93_02930 [Dorea sp.]|nr:hypothetical protein [Dorea sp.]